MGARVPRQVECDAAMARASLDLDDELDDVGRGLLERHLAACEPCAAFTLELRAVTELLRGARLEPHRCEATGALPARRRYAPWAASAAAVAALAFGIASLPYASGPDTREASLTAGDLLALAPVKLPIGQRSAEDDFSGQPAVLEA